MGSCRLRIVLAGVALLLLGFTAGAGAENPVPDSNLNVLEGLAPGIPNPDAVPLPNTGIAPEGGSWADSGSPKNLTPVEEGYRSEVERSWFKAGSAIGARASAARVTALSLGIGNVDAAARALIGSDDEGALGYTLLAVNLAPDLPIAHMALAKAMWRDGQRIRGIREVAAGVAAIFRNFEAITWWFGSLLVMISAVLIVSPLVFMVAVGVSVYDRAAHDLGDLISKDMPGFARAALPALLLLIPLFLGEGIMGLVLVFFALGIVYGNSRYRVALVLAAMLLVMGLYPVTLGAGKVLMALDSDPVASASLAVIQGVESKADLEVLEQARGTSFLADYVLATRVRRLGFDVEALEQYEALHKSYPREAGILANLGNLRFHAGDIEEAIDLYERSAALGDSARIMFNLSQANARLFRIEEFESTLRAAQAIDSAAVADLSRVGRADFVADMPFPMEILRSRLVSVAQEPGAPRLATDFLMPGWLGRSWMNVLGGFGTLAMLGALLSSKFDQASACTRCGRRICGRCDGTVWNSETCDGCHHLFHRPETTDPALRMNRLGELKRRDTRIGRIALVMSLLIPGAGGLWARRPDLGFVGTLLFGMAVVSIYWYRGVVPDPMAVGSAGAVSFLVAGILAMLGYLGVVARGLLIRRNL